MVTSRVEETKGPPMFDTDWSALCQTLYDGVEQGDWVIMFNAHRNAAKKVGIRSVGERACYGS